MTRLKSLRKRWISSAIGSHIVVASLALTVGAHGSPASGDEQAPAAEAFHVERTQLATLGSEHIAHAIHRRTPAGGAIVGWGERVVEWPLDKSPLDKSPLDKWPLDKWPLNQPALREVVPRSGELHFYNGGCAVDINGDGQDEVIATRGKSRAGRDPELLWLEETTRGGAWTVHRIDAIGQGPIAPHDIEPFALTLASGERVRGIVAVIDRRRLVWYEIPRDPAEPWPRRVIADLPQARQSGIAVGDLAGNGRPDVACGMFWAECPADPRMEAWKVRRFGSFDSGGWGGMAKLQIADLDADGRQEIVASQAEIPDAKLGVFSRDAKYPDGMWSYREIDAGLYCPHSLVLADLDANGRIDVLTGEMTAGGWSFPLNPRPRIIAYLQGDDGSFGRQVLSERWGVHEMGLVPKRAGESPTSWTIFAADETQTQKFPDMQTYVNLWRLEGRGGLKPGPRP
jgi:hypothetical protein